MKKREVIDNDNGCMYLLLGGFVAVMLIMGLVLSSSKVLADGDSVTDQIEITVPSACTMVGTVNSAHITTMSSGTYSGVNGIGKTTLTTRCNDYNGFSVYAIGHSNDTDGNNTLIGTNTGETINTGVYTSGDTTSKWSMKITKVTDTTEAYNPNNMTIQNSFDSWHTVPNDYTKIAEYKASTGSSATDATLGAKIETTYDAYMSAAQAADSYEGKVKYVMVHPYDGSAPEKQWSPQPQPSTAGCITYYSNAPTGESEGTMGDQCNVTDGSSVTLYASNFSRSGYGFAGWSNKFDYATSNASDLRFYGPNETITVPEGTTTNGLSLYAVWIESVGSLQDATKVATLCGTGAGSLIQAPVPGSGIATFSSVTALTDQRDNQTYAIAKLADGNCWMIENLRLENTNSDNSTGALAQGYNTSFVGLASPESYSFTNTTRANSLYSTDGSTDVTLSGDYLSYRFPRYKNFNTSNRASNTTNTYVNTYSYGNYYTWAAAIADTTHYSSGDHGTTSICPKGWRLPIGAKTTADKSFGALSVALGGPAGGDTANDSSDPTGTVMSTRFRSFPNNFLYYSGSSSSSASLSSYYWSSTACNNNTSHVLSVGSYFVSPGVAGNNKYYGPSIRCTVASS